MDYVSLLPPEIKAKRIQDKRQALLIKIAVILFILVMVVYAFLLVSSVLTRNNLNSLRSEREDLEMQANALMQYEQLFNQMNAAEATLNSAMGNTPLWSEMLYDLGLSLPVGTWLSDLTLNYTANSGTFNMRGWSFTHSGVGDMLESLEEMNQLSNVRLQASSETTFEGRDAVQFVVDANLLSGPPFVGDADDSVETEPEEENGEEETGEDD